MNKAVKVRKVKSGDGTIYKLEPPYEWQDKQWHYAVAKSRKAEVLYGFMGLPAGSLLFLAKLNEETGGFKLGPIVVDIYGKQRTEAAILKEIDYVAKSS
jgi:hypothetical protein